MSYDRFEHENQIMKTWGIIDDIKDIAEKLDDDTTKEDAKKMLEGLTLLYASRFEKMFELFEDSI